MQYNLTNSELSERIDEHIHSERNRRIMRMKMIDGLTYERIAEIVEMSPRHVKRIVKTSMESIMPEHRAFTEICFS